MFPTQCFSDPQIDNAVLFALVILVGFAAVAWWARNERFDPGHRVFLLCQLGLLWWLSASIGELVARPLDCKLFFAGLAYPGITLTVVAWSLFLFDYSLLSGEGGGRWRGVVLGLAPVVIGLVAVTNPLHHALYGVRSEAAIIDGRVSVLYWHGPLFYLFVLFHYLWVAGALAAVIRALRRSGGPLRPFYSGLLLITSVPVLVSLGYVLAGITLFGFDPTPFAFALSLVAYGWMILSQQTMNIQHIAHSNLFSTLVQPILVIDRDGAPVSANASAESLLRSDGGSALREAVRHLAGQLVRQGRIDEVSHFAIAGAHYRPAAHPIESPFRASRSILGWTLELTDVTVEETTLRALRRAKEKAESASRLQAEFIANVSHELRTPLTSINGSLRLLGSGSLGPMSESAQDVLEVAGRNGERLQTIIDALLDFQKIETGAVEMRSEEVDLADIVQEAVEDLQLFAEERGVCVRLTEPIGPCTAVADRAKVKQVLADVLSNAVKFSPRDGVVDVVLHRTEQDIQVRVSDRGIGIAEGVEDRVFGRFTQVDSSPTRSHSGAGLGMNVAKRLMEMLGGDIYYRSTLGEGTDFYVTLPSI
ncbi:Signal transduction histidine kinase [Tranquillimonas rosea]|uniref:histidine kinase n=1 Tax=Tranquillimonas rosea TaxID=641238 RepID=A0A1H9U8F5_9RHOB|nr:histidine kinase N-terminal 7TM domain-containing protein [Tranquillimonas rosea]SES05528.1 Signal transduction histidine kinase [Tranquillimonas rosea]